MRWILQLLVRFFGLDPVFSAHPARALLAAGSPRPRLPHRSS
jgi:hypothetical protein